MSRAWLLGLVVAAAAGCAKQREAAPAPSAGSAAPAPPKVTVTPAEQHRGQDACRAYVDQLCACAKTKGTPELADKCHLDTSLAQALDDTLSIINNPASSPQNLATVERTMRGLVAQCIQSTAQLSSLGCGGAGSAAP